MDIEKDWTTSAGLRAVVLMTEMGHRCGYVGIPSTHPLHGVDYTQQAPLPALPDDEPVGKRGAIAVFCAAGDPTRLQTPELYFNVHGGITYAGSSKDYPAPSEDALWWYGYDCGHSGDAPAPGSRWRAHAGDVHRTLDYCVDECESLARQLAALTTTAA